MAAGVDPAPFEGFAEFVANTKITGHDLAGNPSPYVPLSALEEYWTQGQIASVLRAFSPRLDIDVDIIRRRYLRVFSTLVYTGHDTVRCLGNQFISRNLSDERLPFSKLPSEWPDEGLFRSLFARIDKSQWLFFPLPFHPDQLHDPLVPSRRVLPISKPVQIAHSSKADVFTVDLHPQYNRLPQDEQGRPCPTQQTFVFKVYHNRKHEGSYRNELRALRRLSRPPAANLIKLHGSFQQLGSYCLILEYADGGDLAEFFRACPPPATADDVVLFWKSLFQVFSGLDQIHQLRAYDEEIVKGIHEDIRPENILLMKGPSGSPYDFTPKIADFGLYSRVRTAKSRPGGSGVGLDNSGAQRFSSPECSNHTIQRLKGLNTITTAADIFSIGAVLSHTAAWVVGGCEEQRAYLNLRKTYLETNLPRFRGSGYEGCFHNSLEPLPVVAQQHRALAKRCRPADDVTPRVLEWVERCMLVQPPRDRSSARDILERFEQLLERRALPSPFTPFTAASDVTAQSLLWSPALSPSSADGVAVPTPAPHPTSPAAAVPTRPRIGVSQIHKFKSDLHEGRPADEETARLVDYLEHNLGGRDQFFFIDDSRSMRAEQQTIADGFRALACIAKRLDPDQVELAFASRPRTVFRARRTSRLAELVARCPYKGEGHLMEDRLGELVDAVIVPRLPLRLLGLRNVNPWARRKVSVYVFTDGDWGEADSSADACGVERPVRRLIDELKRRRLDRTQVSLHFVRFGNKENGRRHLRRLDEFGRSDDGWDIVDVKHIQTGVAEVLLGPLTRSNDDIPATPI